MAGEFTAFDSTGSQVSNHPDSRTPSDPMDDMLRQYVLNGVVNGVPTPEQAYGLTSLPMQQGFDESQPTLEEQQAQLEAQSPDKVMALQAELDALKSQLGTTENEKGVLRKRTEEATSALNDALMQQKLMMAQFEELMGRQGQPQYPQQQAQYPQYQQPQYPAPYAPQFYQAPQDPFASIKDDEMLMGAQVKQLLQETVAPVVYNAFQRAEASRVAVEQLQNELLSDKKRQAGITPRDEQILMLEQPWIKSLPNERARADAMIGVMAGRKAQAAVQAAQPAPAQPQSPQNLAVRRLTTTGPQGQPSGAAETQSATMPMEAIMAEWRETEKIPLGTGKRDAAQRAILSKYGVRSMQDWRQ